MDIFWNSPFYLLLTRFLSNLIKITLLSVRYLEVLQLQNFKDFGINTVTVSVRISDDCHLVGGAKLSSSC